MNPPVPPAAPPDPDAPASGTQFEISHGQQQVTIVEVGAGLRTYTVAGHDVLDGYAADQRCTGARGHPLIPWPNRIADGAYRFNGHEHQLALTEPEKHNAIHGLLRWRNWTCDTHLPDRVVMSTRLHPMKGYPFALEVAISYQLSDSGLSVHTRATNIGQQSCPFGAGQHPYLRAGTSLINPAAIQFEAAQFMPTDDRGIPIGRSAVPGSAFDFRTSRVIGDLEIDNTFTDFARDPQGRAWVHLCGPEGERTSLWADENYPFLEIYTAHTQPAPHRRAGLGVEPMTCAPNAYRTGAGLLRLQPGQAATAAWGLLHTAASPTD